MAAGGWRLGNHEEEGALIRAPLLFDTALDQKIRRMGISRNSPDLLASCEEGAS
jgi:hypothetical protein